MKPSKEIGRVFEVIAALFVVFFLFSMADLRHKQNVYYKRATQYEKANRLVKAADNYVMAIYMHTPFSSKEKESVKALMRIAKKFDEDNQTLKALYVYERLRSAIYGTRWFTAPHKRVLPEIDKRIIAIRTDMLKKAGYKKSVRDTEKEMRHIMETDLAPNPFLAFVGVMAFLFFVGSVIFLIVFSVKDNRFVWKRFVLGLPGVILFWVMWLAMMYLA